MNVAEIINSQFDYKRDGADYLKVSLDLCLYFQGAIHEHGKGIQNFYNIAMETIGDRFTFYQSEWMKSPKKVNAATRTLLPDWLEDTEDRGMYMLFLESGPTKSTVSDAAFSLYAMGARNLGALRMVMPVDILEDGPMRFLDLAQRAAADLPFLSGHSGFAIHLNDCGELASPALRAVWPIVARFHGIDYTATGCLLRSMERELPEGRGLKRVNWLTFVGEPLLSNLGGPEALTNKLGDGPTVHPLPSGLMVQAGPEPGLGDCNRQETLPLYHRVGQALAPVRLRNHPAFIESPETRVWDDDLTQAFLGRFDAEPGRPS